jgi:polyhydroxyalkanoate synthesis repressor PhaR
MLDKADSDHGKKDAVVIKKYANRRLYNTETSSYVTLDDLAQMVRVDKEFVVFDAKTGDDLTHSVLTQIIVEQESRSGGQSLLPTPFLRQLIRFYDDSMARMVPSYLQMSLETLTREQERFRSQMTSAWTGNAFEAYQEHTRRNLALFEQAMKMFTPFGAGIAGAKMPNDPMAPVAPSPGPATGKPLASYQPITAPAAPSAATSAAANAARDDLAEMKLQLAAMQAKIEKLSQTRD